MFEKAVVWPWEVSRISTPILGEIFQDLQHIRGFGPCFMKQPPPWLSLQSIALPAVAAQVHAKDQYVAERSQLRAMSREDRLAAYAEIGLTSKHRYFLYLVDELRNMDVLASYLGATVSLSTFHKATAVTMEDLVSLVLTSALEKDPLLKELERIGFLIVKFPMNIYTGWEKASGGIFTMLANRLSAGRVTAFIDVADGDCLTEIGRGYLPTKELLVRQIDRMNLGQTRLRYFMEGPNTRIVWPSGLRERSEDVAPATTTTKKPGGGNVGRKTTLV